MRAIIISISLIWAALAAETDAFFNLSALKVDQILLITTSSAGC